MSKIGNFVAVYVDASDKCSKALFQFGASGFTRAYDIKV